MAVCALKANRNKKPGLCFINMIKRKDVFPEACCYAIVKASLHFTKWRPCTFGYCTALNIVKHAQDTCNFGCLCRVCIALNTTTSKFFKLPMQGQLGNIVNFIILMLDYLSSYHTHTSLWPLAWSIQSILVVNLINVKTL